MYVAPRCSGSFPKFLQRLLRDPFSQNLQNGGQGKSGVKEGRELSD